MTTARFEQIRSAALEAFYRNGYHGTSLREIASDVGIRTPSLYNYIDSKQNLLFQLMSDVMGELLERTQRAVAQAGCTSAERLHAAISAFVLFNIEHPHQAAVSDAGFAALTQEQRQVIVGLRDRFDGVFARIIADGLADGSFQTEDAEVAKVTMLSACARVYFWYRPAGRLPARQLAAAMSGYLVRGLINTTAHSDGQR